MYFILKILKSARGSKMPKFLNFVALIFWLVVLVPILFRAKKRDIIKTGDYITLNVLSLLGCQFLWLYILYNHIL